jgi:ubiquinone/menaquinone biosynthesis C-methylase UbiE
MDWREYWNSGPMVKSEDPCKQVGRTQNRQNYSEENINLITARILDFLQADTTKDLLELACGNGMVTHRIAPHFKSVKAVDFSQPLIEQARKNFARDNVEYAVGDAVELGAEEGRYDAIMIYFAFQYFQPEQARVMFSHFQRLLKPGGRILLGEVADGDRVWNFYRGWSGRWRYYTDLIRGKPIIGCWWKPAELLQLADEFGMELTLSYHLKGFPGQYFRYDALFERPV